MVLALTVVVPVHPPRVQALEEVYGDFDPAREGVTFARGGVPVARILLIGDSVSWTMWAGLGTWNRQHPDEQVEVHAAMALGCTLGEPQTDTRVLDVLQPPTMGCRRLRQRVADMVASNRYDAIVIEMVHMDLGERLMDGEWRHLGDPVFDAWFRGEVDVLADIVAEEGAPVLWASTSHTRAHRGARRWQDHDDNDPARVDRLNEIVVAALDDRPGFAVVDVAGWLRASPGGEFDRAIREDGVHYTFEGSDAVAAWMVPQVLDAVTAHRPRVSASGAAPEVPVSAADAGR